ncbi:MAG TPA: DUF6159 family protein [Aggregatilinea sp.]|jgi:hypothetical protein|uniref:DUF6159 family protein n=1 Tax=Aggregatilinea sp. TaxID=2806333 RepID=UPI002BA8C7E3|nr:DUF6159 family protein [Aggregatilinea sp.]HML23821.1 DUF6159 family protein [Aggregatilinea sp.]
MFTRLSRSWELVKASAAVLRSDKELILFPLVSFIASVIIMITFAVPMALAGLFDEVSTNGQFGPAGIIVGFLFYFVMYTVVIFTNTALVGAAMIRLRGGDPTLRDGIDIARTHVGQILGYAAISATVGVILRAISERGGLVGRIVSSVIGFGWNLATFLVVPILVVEDIGPVDAIKRSTSLLKRTWGEQIVGNFSIGMIFGLLGLAIIVATVPMIIFIASAGSVFGVVLLVGMLVAVLVGLGLISSTLNGIYVAALYRYAVEGEISEQFDSDLIASAFRMK